MSMSKAGTLLKLQELASKAGQKERALVSASPTRRVILQIELNALRNAMMLASRRLTETWRMR